MFTESDLKHQLLEDLELSGGLNFALQGQFGVLLILAWLDLIGSLNYRIGDAFIWGFT